MTGDENLDKLLLNFHFFNILWKFVSILWANFNTASYLQWKSARTQIDFKSVNVSTGKEQVHGEILRHYMQFKMAKLRMNTKKDEHTPLVHYMLNVH